MGALLWALVVASADGGEAGIERRTRETMHTLVTITLPMSMAPGRREAAFDDAFSVFEMIDSTLNEWRKASALSRVNAGAGGPGVEAPANLCEVVRLSLEGARRTGGLFDPTWASVRNLWRFGTAETLDVPTPAQIGEACPAVNWKNVEVLDLKDPTAAASCRIRLATGATQLGLGGIVKGWGVDKVVRQLRALGVVNFAVQAGGDLYVAGQPQQVGLREPRGAADESFARLPVADAAFSTSGDYEAFFEKDGVRFHHLLDPRTCRPARASVAVSVLARSATDAEFLTKAAFILGPAAGIPFLRAWHAEAVWVTPDGKVHSTPGLTTRLKANRPRGFEPRTRAPR